MDVLGSLQTLATCKDAAGVAGNIFAFGLFLSPVPTFRRIIRNESTEQFSGLPYIYALLNCLITAWSCIVHFPVCEGGFSTKARTLVRRDDSQIREDDGNYKDTKCNDAEIPR
ncbi:Bidirectional sugar transporter SWEET2 [Sesamum angolense]|uniref:Bidirectional sugar transporter SWEET2 n=1 Tax=Sesamum angolense TaxID=2727404 RepID=A0AAE1WRN5_9LAMI|nr:Bidirectional sugar transporter SWEET2 [Sesamum angolense]